MAGECGSKVPGGPEEDALGGQRFTKEGSAARTGWLRSFPGSRGPGLLLLLLVLSLATCFLLLVTTLVQVSRLPTSPCAEAEDRQQDPRLAAPSPDPVRSGLEQIRQQLGQINASLARLCRPCPWDWEPFWGSCYFFSRTPGSWESSVSSCRDLGAQLVVIDSQAEQTFLSHWGTRKKQVSWIGLSDRSSEGSWQWVDGTPLLHGFWHKGEPNDDGDEDCAELLEDTWNDNKCTARNFWVCERRAGPCPGL